MADKGLILLYTGNDKEKTTAALSQFRCPMDMLTLYTNKHVDICWSLIAKSCQIF